MMIRAPHIKAQPAQRRGFTLVELLVVIAIIILLVSMLAPSVTRFMLTAQVNASNSRVGLIDSAIRMYQADFNDTPTRLTAEQDSLPPSNDGSTKGSVNLVKLLTGHLDSDGATGFGMRVTPGGRLYGPYGGTETLPMNDKKEFIDTFGRAILYFRFDGNTYNVGDNDNPPPLKYFKNGLKDTGTWTRKDFVLCSPGADMKWYDPAKGNVDDDPGNLNR